MFGKEHSQPQFQEVTTKDETEVNGFTTYDALNWENGAEIPNPPNGKKQFTATTTQDQHKNLFCTPIAACFALLPYAFWEIMVHEINQYMDQCLGEKRRKLIAGNW